MAFKDTYNRFNSYIKDNYYRPSEETNQLTGRGYDPAQTPTYINTLFDNIFGTVKPTATIQISKSETLGMFALLILGGILAFKL